MMDYKKNIEKEGYKRGLLEKWGESCILHHVEKEHSLLDMVPHMYMVRILASSGFIVGFVVTAVFVILELSFFPQMGATHSSVVMWFFYGYINILLVVLEFILLLHMGFIGAAYYIRQAGRELNPDLIQSITRSVLEVPEPNIHRYGINPYKSRSKTYYLSLIAYKLKVVASSFLAKLLMRKILSRTVLRSYSAFIAAPVTGFWNYWVMLSTMKEVRLRLSSRLCVFEILKEMENIKSPDFRVFIIRMVAVRLMLFGRYNVNLDLLLVGLSRVFSVEFLSEKEIEDISIMKDKYEQLNLEEQVFAKKLVLFLWAFKRKNLSRNEKNLLIYFNVDINHVKEKRKTLCKFNKSIDVF
jgi:hypothetical protein